MRDAAQALPGRLLGKVGARPEEVTAASLVGNTAMHHLFLGLPVEQLAVAPYTPAVTEGRVFEVPGFPALYALPDIAGFVGADAVAAALAAGLDAGEETVLLVDVGTNGEVLLRHAGRLYAARRPPARPSRGARSARGCGPVPAPLRRCGSTGGTWW